MRELVPRVGRLGAANPRGEDVWAENDGETEAVDRPRAAWLLLGTASGHAAGGASEEAAWSRGRMPDRPSGGRFGAAQVPHAAASPQEPVPGATLFPVVLPDLGRAHTSVQAQLREAYEALNAAQPAGRGEAYGELGKLLMAGDYLDEAERCFRNARVLVPDDVRWPYYLGHLARSTDG